MKWFKNLKIGLRLMIAFLALSALSGAVGYIGIGDMSTIEGLSRQLYEHELLGLSYLKEANLNLVNGSREVRNLLLASSQKDRDDYIKAIDQAAQQERMYLEKAKPLIHDERGKALLAQYEQDAKQFDSMRKKLFELASHEAVQKQRATVDFVEGSMRDTHDKLSGLLSEITKIKEASADKAASHATAVYEESRLTMTGIVIGAVLIGVLLGVFITRSITKPLGRAVETADALAEGDLTVDIDVDSKDETGQLLAAMKRMLDKLSGIISEVNGSADGLASASEQVSATSQSLSQASSEQASSVEETSASMEEMTASISQNTENAKVTDGMAAKAAKEAAEGGEAVQPDRGGHEEHRREDRHHRRHRLPDQPAGPERGHRGGPGRRTRQGLRGGRRGGAQTRGA